MARKSKYPTPSEAVERFQTGVQYAGTKWVQRTQAGASRYNIWYTGFANTIYPVVASLPDREALPDIASRIQQRGIPVAQAISRLGATYRKNKAEQVARTLVRTAVGGAV